MCPDGPFRKKMFVDEELIVGELGCEELIPVDFPVLIGGETVMMKVFKCE